MCQQKETSPVPDKSFALGTLAETVEALGASSGQFASQLYVTFVSMLQDADEEVRSNAVFAVGVLLLHGGDAVVAYPLLKFYRSLYKSSQYAPDILIEIRYKFVSFSCKAAF